MDDLLRGGWTILPSAVVMPRSIYGRCGGFCEEFKGPGGDDPFMWLMAREHGPFVYVPEPLMHYRETPLAAIADKYAAGLAIGERLILKPAVRRPRVGQLPYPEVNARKPLSPDG